MNKRIYIFLICILSGAVSLSGQSSSSKPQPASQKNLENITYATPLPGAPAVTLASGDDLQEFKGKMLDELHNIYVKMLSMQVDIANLEDQVKKLEAKQKAHRK